MCELFQKPKFLTWWNSFPTCLLTEDGKARQGKAKQDQDAVPLGQKWVEHLVTEIATKMLLPALEKQLFKAGSIASPLCRCCHLDVVCANNISSWKKTSRNDSTALVYLLPKGRNQLISRNGISLWKQTSGSGFCFSSKTLGKWILTYKWHQGGSISKTCLGTGIIEDSAPVKVKIHRENEQTYVT